MSRIQRKRRRFKNRPVGERHRELISSPSAAPTQLRVMAFGPDGIREKQSPGMDEVARLQNDFPMVWLDLAGFADLNVIKKIGDHFSIHALVMEDIVRTHQRPKVEDYPDALFIIARMAPCQEQEETEQLAIYMTGNCLITFQEFPGDDLESVRNRIRMERGRIRSEKIDYLAYAIIDAVIDAYFPLVDQYGEVIETLEESLVTKPDRDILTDIYSVRRKVLELRRAMWPLREMLTNLYRGDSSLITRETQVYFRDCFDHTVQLIELMENYRELASNLMEVYLSSASNRLNEIMKVLTIISAIFIPLTFIAGVYGMNFQPDSSPWNMPEIVSYYGYPICLAVMFVIALGEIYFFWKKGWLSDNKKVPDKVTTGNMDKTSGG